MRSNLFVSIQLGT